MAAFETELLARTGESDRRRAQELDERAMRGEGTPEDALESIRLVWPAYFASRERVMSFPSLRVCVDAYAGLLEAAATANSDAGAPAREHQRPVRLRRGSAQPAAHRAGRRADCAIDPRRICGVAGR